MKLINSKDAPAALGPYSHAVFSNSFLFISGQLGIDPQTGALAPDISGQMNQLLENLKAILKEGSLTPDHIVKTTIFIKNMADFPIVNELYGQFFQSHKPARSTVEVSNLPKAALIEMEAIAQRNS